MIQTNYKFITNLRIYEILEEFFLYICKFVIDSYFRWDLVVYHQQTGYSHQDRDLDNKGC